MNTSADLVKQAKSGFQEVGSIPKKQTAVVTCFDTRLNPLQMLKADRGEFQIFRNAGGVITDDVIRSLIVSTHEYNVTKVNLVMHTDCGMLQVDQRAIEADLGPLPFDIGGFSDLEAELESGAAKLRAEPLLPLPDGVATFIYNVAEGTLLQRT